MFDVKAGKILELSQSQCPSETSRQASLLPRVLAFLNSGYRVTICAITLRADHANSEDEIAAGSRASERAGDPQGDTTEVPGRALAAGVLHVGPQVAPTRAEEI